MSTHSMSIAEVRCDAVQVGEQFAADQRRRHHIAMLRQRVVAVVGEKSELTVSEAAAMARELRPA